ncbi:neural Wiskott-Aldrich syndrome protein-like [Canis lupus dingo]|uniref:neural Wiskott-Aldrich syndrome protein-like n=1 Tax=Canis lupus dingo TaxID=286419 RepID=UPI000DC6C539|nr:neural Wiskott-Aldrich syndrome protein-like [Canis lupus dingo]
MWPEGPESLQGCLRRSLGPEPHAFSLVPLYAPQPGPKEAGQPWLPHPSLSGGLQPGHGALPPPPFAPREPVSQDPDPRPPRPELVHPPGSPSLAAAPPSSPLRQREPLGPTSWAAGSLCPPRRPPCLPGGRRAGAEQTVAELLSIDHGSIASHLEVTVQTPAGQCVNLAGP